MNVVPLQSVRSFIDESLFFEEFGGEKPKTSWLKIKTGLRKKSGPKSSVVTEILGMAASGFSGVNTVPGGDVVVVRTGVVLLAHTAGAWAVYGWKNELSDPRCEAPGAVAVDVLGNIWQATGGNEYEGAEAWEVLRTAA